MPVDSLREKPFWVRVALLGFALFLALMLTYAVVGIFNGESPVFPIIVAIPALVAAGLIIRFGSWSLIIGALVGAFGLIFFGPEVPVGLATPDSFFNFITGTVGLTAVIFALVGCIVAFVQGRRGTAALAGPPAAVRVIQGVMVLIILTGVVSAVLTVANRETVSAADKQGAIAVTANKSEWSTDRIEASSSGTLKLLLKNSDPYLHVFHVKELNMDFKLKPGSERLIVLRNPLAGTFEFKCTLHPDMKGTIEIN
jgi:plastocyanin